MYQSDREDQWSDLLVREREKREEKMKTLALLVLCAVVSVCLSAEGKG